MADFTTALKHAQSYAAHGYAATPAKLIRAIGASSPPGAIRTIDARSPPLSKPSWATSAPSQTG